MPPAPARAGRRNGAFTRRSLWAGCAPGTRTGRPGARPLTANFRRTGEFALESCSSVKAPRLGGSVEWGRGGRAGNCCCGLPNHSLHAPSGTHAPHAQATFLFFSDGPPPRNKQHIVIRSGRVEGATRGNQKLESLKLPRVVRSLHRMDCCTQRASLGLRCANQPASIDYACSINVFTCRKKFFLN